MTWVFVIVGFAALIMLHEGGHFVVAKMTGMRVERFFLFFPPKLWSFKRGETEYGIGMIPLGGFVKITGMNPEELEEAEVAAEGTGDSWEGRPELATSMEAGRDTPEGLLERIESAGQSPADEVMTPDVFKRAYYNQPVWKRVAVIAAGPIVNILLAFVILFGLSFALDKAVGSGVEVHRLTDSSAAAGKLQPGDRIVSIDGVPSSNLQFNDRIDRFRSEINSHKCAGTPVDGCQANTPVHLVVNRDGTQTAVSVTPQYSAAESRSLIGVEFGPTQTEPQYGTVGQGISYAGDTMWLITSKTVSAIGRIFLPAERKQLSGPVGSSRALNEAIGFGPKEGLFVLALISLSLGIINLFPFLPLDGGHIFWSLVEKIRGRRVPFFVIERASAIGFLLIMLLFVVGLTNDLGRLGTDALNPK